MTEQEKRSKIAHLAEKVKGWKVKEANYQVRAFFPRDIFGRESYLLWEDEPRGEIPWNPFGSIADAMELLEEWRTTNVKRRWYSIDSPYNGGMWSCSVSEWSREDFQCTSKSVTEAICNALLQATGWKETEDQP